MKLSTNAEPAAPAPPRRDERFGGWAAGPGAWWCLPLLLAAALWAFWPVLHSDFVELDDFLYVQDNPQVLGGLTAQNLAWAFTTVHAHNWHPVTWISHMLDATLFGPRAGAEGPHLVNLGLHLGNTLLLFAFWRRTTGALWRSALVAGLFALHPLRVESVAWISERKDVLSAFFFLLTLLAYRRYVGSGCSRAPENQNPNAAAQISALELQASSLKPQASSPKPQTSSLPPSAAAVPTPSELLRRTGEPPASSPQPPAFPYYVLALVLFALGLMSKPMVVSLPVVLLLLDYWPLGRWQWTSLQESVPQLAGLVREKLPFFALAACSCVATLIAQSHGAVRDLTRFPLSARLENALVSYPRYLGKLVWPSQLSVLYPHPGHWPLGSVALAALVVGLLWLGAVAIRRRYRFAFTGWAWFFVMLLPVIGLVQVGDQSLADRYTYLPCIGALVVVAWGAGELAAAWPRLRPGLALLAGLGLAACAWGARQQTACWQNSDTLYAHALAVTHNSPLVRQMLSLHCYNLGNFEKDAGRPWAAAARYRQALQLNPANASAHNNLGLALQTEAGLEDAVLELLGLGFWREPSWRAWSEAAAGEYLQAVRLDPASANARNNLGVALTRQGKLDEAIAQFTQALRLAPDNASGHNNLGALLARRGRYAEAIQEYAAAARLAPGSPAVLDNLGDALAHEGRTNEATAQYRQALRLNPRDPVAARRLQALGAAPQP